MFINLQGDLYNLNDYSKISFNFASNSILLWKVVRQSNYGAESRIVERITYRDIDDYKEDQLRIIEKTK